MRSVVFDASGILEAFDYRGVLIHKQEIQANEKVKLPFTQKNLFKFNGVFFGVCEGVGDLDYRDYPTNLNFNALSVETIENYLLELKEPENKQQKALLADFLKVYDKNIEKGFIYLAPKFFLEKEKQLIETTTRLLTSYQIFLNQARESATNQINTNKTQAITNINEAKNTANNEISENKQEVLSNITQEKQQATREITEAKKTAFNELLETLKPKFSGLFVGAYYIRNVIYIKGGWERKIKDLSDYELEKSKKYKIEVFFSFVTAQKKENSACFTLKTTEGFLKESIQKITHKYASQIYYKKLLVESVSGVLSLYHGYFYGNINYFNEAVVTIISTKRALKRL
ncbi:hypothetical protein KVE52_02320 [Helicobacter pylori]|nr:hypothetical protein KVE52_02320 [Helicobacter pylori]